MFCHLQPLIRFQECFRPPIIALQWFHTVVPGEKALLQWEGENRVLAQNTMGMCLLANAGKPRKREE